MTVSTHRGGNAPPSPQSASGPSPRTGRLGGDPQPPLRERQRQEREQLILKAAQELFFEKGYNDTSMEDIAARVGIAKGTVYLHFSSKEELVLALFERGIRYFTSMLDATLAGEGTPRHKLELVIEQMFSSMDGPHSRFFTGLFRNPELLVRLREKRHLMDEIWQGPTRRLTELFEQGKAAGEFDPAIPTPLMMSMFWSLLSPHGYRRTLEQEQFSTEQLAQSVRRFFLRGIAADRTTTPTPGGDHV